MSLVDKQDIFTGMVADLIRFARAAGYQVTFGDAYRDRRVHYGHPHSLHRIRLAVDINLFKDGQFIETSEGHLELGEFWESIGGSWGGRFNDGNHYSLEHNGVK